MPDKLDLLTEWKGDVLLVGLDGRLAAAAADRLVRKIDTTIGIVTGSLRAVILNCSKMNYVSGYGWHSILQIGRSLRSRGSRLLLAELQPDIRVVFENSSFLGLLSVHDTVAEAHDSLRRSRRSIRRGWASAKRMARMARPRRITTT